MKVGKFQPELGKIYFFYQQPQPLYDIMQNQFEKPEFVQGVNFENINSLKNNGTKYLLVFDNSCAEICNSKDFVDIATAGEHRDFHIIYIRHNLFQQSNFGRGVELQNTHIVRFKSPRGRNQVGTLSVQSVLGLTFAHWYRDATAVFFGLLLIDLPTRTDNRIH